MATEGGRFDFEDGGAYVGCWSEGRAHGPGLVTGPRGQGEFSGSWQDGFEASGVYIWPSGNTYEGEWRQGKRHGLGVEAKGRWVYRGEWMTGFRGRYGVRCSDSSGARYEGTWQLGMQDGAGVETYADGGTYSGCWFHGTRHGLGVRQSVPFGLAAPYRDEAADATAASDTAASATAGRHRDESLTSLRSARPDDAAVTEDAERPEGRRRRRLPGDEFRAGFVLSSRHCEAEVTASSGEGAEDSNPNSPGYLRRRLRATGGGTSLGRALLGRLRKQRSAGDIEQQQQQKQKQQQQQQPQESPSPSPGPHHQQQQQLDKQKQIRRRFLGHRSSSVRSAISERASPASGASVSAAGSGELRAGEDAEYEEPLDPSVTEVFCGEWKQDRRCGLGVAERSDGLKYEGEWEGNRRHGYGATTFPDGSCEAGKYRGNLLNVSTARRGRLFLLKSSRLRERVDTAVREARVAMAEALKRAENAQSRQQVSQQKAALADAAAEKARLDSESARRVAREFAPDFHQPGPDFLKRRTETDVLSSLSLTTARSRASRASPPANHRVASTNRSLTRQHHIEESSPARLGSNNSNSASANACLQVADSVLQVGGSRRGSFRLSPAAARSAAAAAASAEPESAEATPPAEAAAPAAQARYRDRVEPLARVLDSAPAIDHFDQYRAAPSLYRRKRDSGLGRDSSFEDSPSNSGFVASDRATLAAAATAAAAAAASGAGTANVPHAGRAANSNANHRGDSDSGLSEVSGGSLGRSRRRTLPSLLGSNSARPSTLVGPAELEDSSHSRDRQQSAGAATFIIENGVRKRVLHSISSTAAAAISSPHRYNNRKQNSLPHQRSLRHPQQLQQHRLCRIESQARLCKDLGEGSLPDVSVCRYIVRRGLMSREEAAQLGRQRRLELLKLEEMQNQQRRQRQQQQRAEDGDAVLADVRECKRLPVDDPLHSFVSRGGLRRRLLCSRCASIEPSSNCSTSLRVQDPTTASQHWRRLLLLSLEEPQAATNSGRSSTDSTPSRTTRTSSSTFAAAARLSGAAAAHAFWRVVNWLRLNTGELVQEHFLLLFVLIVNTVLAVLVFHLLNSNAKLP